MTLRTRRQPLILPNILRRSMSYTIGGGTQAWMGTALGGQLFEDLEFAGLVSGPSGVIQDIEIGRAHV